MIYMRGCLRLQRVCSAAFFSPATAVTSSHGRTQPKPPSPCQNHDFNRMIERAV